MRYSLQKAVAAASTWMVLCRILASGSQTTTAFAEDGIVLHLGKDSPALHIPVGDHDAAQHV
ncbi:hypothetical protein [Rhizobium ruizarguesonis]|uniref:Uncharacterized protein n=1 Tax=Rhizobium ruizarguesonis TaxID=2081791 RepID=A0AB38HV48_9HYPH|nr:hypothetical protein [Rhizobium ruizarguesonis]TCA28513.1 hypothetical protein E0H70_20145 [Rhizobium leguminosarum bv. viciae]NEI03305.1 hypothetical protein [Rhizobium ruizarguesonis]TAY83915.1 hypothetical protein ELH85_35370 [Rhizobium ruizarguesonis]TAZ66954.1 hypothetical protein ELH68_34225 [Rhizobium ruizarguesonis]TAZ90027.1 hypothetical protein ELH64_34575 [Rhizobium ruizarguesonis]